MKYLDNPALISAFAASISSVAAIMAVIIGVINNRLNRKQSVEIEKIKSELNRNTYKHQLQFSKEFNLYEELWQLTSAYIKLVARISLDLKNKSFAELKDQYLHLISGLVKNSEFISSNEPFLPKHIIAEFQKIGELFSTVSIILVDRVSFDEQKLEVELINLSRQLSEVKEQIEKAIRERITVDANTNKY